jgi:hypothetical protein
MKKKAIPQETKDRKKHHQRTLDSLGGVLQLTRWHGANFVGVCLGISFPLFAKRCARYQPTNPLVQPALHPHLPPHVRHPPGTHPHPPGRTRGRGMWMIHPVPARTGTDPTGCGVRWSHWMMRVLGSSSNALRRASVQAFVQAISRRHLPSRGAPGHDPHKGVRGGQPNFARLNAGRVFGAIHRLGMQATCPRVPYREKSGKVATRAAVVILRWEAWCTHYPPPPMHVGVHTMRVAKAPHRLMAIAG